MTQIRDLKPGDVFHYYNVSDHPNNFCTFVSVSKTATGRDSFNYRFHGSLHKGLGSAKVNVISQ